MKQYIALHTYKKSCEETWKKLGEMADDLALRMEQGKTPARCPTTWNPYVHGRRDYIFCLWEADEPAGIIATLGELNDYINTDILRVDAIAWADVAKAAKAKVAA